MADTIYRIFEDEERIFEGDESQLFDQFGLYPGGSLKEACERNGWTYDEQEDDWNG